jgi:hypothetical protein
MPSSTEYFVYEKQLLACYWACMLNYSKIGEREIKQNDGGGKFNYDIL